MRLLQHTSSHAEPGSRFHHVKHQNEKNTLTMNKATQPRANELRRERPADLPVMAEWIDYAAQAPPIRLLHRDDLLGTCRKCLREHRIRIRHGQDHANGTTAQRLWTEVAMLRRLVTQPKLRTINRQP